MCSKTKMEDSDSEDSSNLSEGDMSDSDLSESEKEQSDDQAANELESDDDEVVKAIKLEKQKKLDHPPVINTEDYIVDISFHPVNDYIALGTITGDVLLYKYGKDENRLAETFELHMEPCRDIEFDPTGECLISTAKDRSIMITDVASGKLINCYENCHDEPVYSMKSLDRNFLVTGDETGTVKMWDIRKSDPIFSIKTSEDHVADMITTESQKYLACASADGVLTAIDLKAHKIYASSEVYDAEFTCMGLLRSNTKLVVCTSKGKQYLFNWMEFGLHTDEYIGLKTPISSMIPITENIIVSSGDDGVLRAAHLFPHRQLGVVGQHTMPVEKMDISHNGKYIASCSHNNDVKFWNISYFERLEKVIDLDKKSNKKKDLVHNLPSSKRKNVSDFFSGLTK